MMIQRWDLPEIFLEESSPAYRHAWAEAVDMFSADGIGFSVKTDSNAAVPMRVTLYPLQNGRPEFIESASAQVLLSPGGGEVEVPFAWFDCHQMVRAHLKYIQAVEFTLQGKGKVILSGAGAVKSGDLLVEAIRSSCAAQPGERMLWQLRMKNGLNQPRFVAIHADFYGREVLAWTHPASVTLPPLGETIVDITSVMKDVLPEGGVEERCFTLLVDGIQQQTITLYAARKRTAAFLLHTEEEWTQLRKVLRQDEAVRAVFEQEYIAIAEQWEVALPAEHHRWVYTDFSHDKVLHTAIAWKLTDNPVYLEKVLQWLRGFLDEKYGYLQTKYCYFEFPKAPDEAPADKYLVHHANSAGWVQEGEFMTRLACVYDLVRGEPGMTPDMHATTEQCMRAYMAFVDWRQTDGDGNNFQIIEASASLHFALLLQDEELIRRFLAGKNGLYDLMGAVFSDDGSYFEGATNYLRLAAEALGTMAAACQHAGRNLKDVLVPAACDASVLHSPWALKREAGKPFLGMSFSRFEPVRKPVRRLKDYFDNLMQLLDDQGMLFSANDSNEQSFARVMQLGYYLYHDPAYLPAAKQAAPDLLYGLHMQPLDVTQCDKGLHINRGNGFAVLRKDGVQVVMKFGQHGGYHGHFDRLSLVSVMRNGQTFHNMEYTWYGYVSFLFKMWVQTSMAHDMVVVDGRMQEPTPCQLIYQQETADFQAVCAQTTARWCDPPYGGQTPYLAKFPEDKCTKEGRYILQPDKPRPQGDIGEYSEPIFQRRLVVLAEGCLFVWDYLEAAHAHTFDCLYHPMGGMTADLPSVAEHTSRFNRDPFGAGQFIMNCHHYDLNKGVQLHFRNARKRVNDNDQVDHLSASTVHALWPAQQRLIIGRFPEKTDTFANENDYQDPDMLQSPCRKVVALRQSGTSALFITALETGENSCIASITAESAETLLIRRNDGSMYSLHVTGMDTKSGQIRVEYQERMTTDDA